MTHSHLAIAMADLAEISPETIIKAYEKLRSRIEASALAAVIIGSGAALKNVAAQLDPKLDFPQVRAPDKVWSHQCFLQIDDDGEPIKRGSLSADGGRFAFEAEGRRVRMTRAGRVGGIVTALLNKQALHKGGRKYTGHTEIWPARGVKELRDGSSSLSLRSPVTSVAVAR